MACTADRVGEPCNTYDTSSASGSCDGNMDQYTGTYLLYEMNEVYDPSSALYELDGTGHCTSFLRASAGRSLGSSIAEGTFTACTRNTTANTHTYLRTTPTGDYENFFYTETESERAEQ